MVELEASNKLDVMRDVSPGPCATWPVFPHKSKKGARKVGLVSEATFQRNLVKWCIRCQQQTLGPLDLELLPECGPRVNGRPLGISTVTMASLWMPLSTRSEKIQ